MYLDINFASSIVSLMMTLIPLSAGKCQRQINSKVSRLEVGTMIKIPVFVLYSIFQSAPAFDNVTSLRLQKVFLHKCEGDYCYCSL